LSLNRTPFLLLGIVIGLSVAAIIFMIIDSVYGEQYTYNMTKNETDQYIISELCYQGVDIGECDLLYGSITKTYGEALK